MDKKIINYKLKKEDIHKLINYATKVPSKAIELKREVRKQIVTAITAAFAFIIALTWRDAIRSSIDSVVAKLGVSKTVYFYEFIIALIITLICIGGILIFSRFSVKDDKK